VNKLLQPRPPDQKLDQIIKIAVTAVGGQGGGVLTSWIESLARSQNYVCQATSVAGVAQRTGATIYYIEMLPHSDKTPVFSLAPAEGDVDIVIAAEMMEVGRAIIRGFVTPDRTTLIGSNHRAFAVSEKVVPGNGMANAEEVQATAEIASRKLILANMDDLASQHGSVISSSLFGALAGSEALPFERAAFEEAIRASGKGVDASLNAFDAGFWVAKHGEEIPKNDQVANLSPKIVGPEYLLGNWLELSKRVDALPGPTHKMAHAGLAKVVDYQDCSYGEVYLDHLSAFIDSDDDTKGWELAQTAAKYIANALCYDDIIRVADLKTRAPRGARIRNEMLAKYQNIVKVTEFFHPRAEEIVSLMPEKMGKRWEESASRMALLHWLFSKGRRLRTDRLLVFVFLNTLGGLKRYRLRTRRHAVETAHLEDWVKDCVTAAKTDYALAIELLKNQRLIKGYSDTHMRGLSKFATVMSASKLLKGRKDAAEWMARLRTAALQDEDGLELEGAIQTIKSFSRI
jgi:indolepyruvate ferredoxin oxidoreductase beta subunit